MARGRPKGKRLEKYLRDRDYLPHKTVTPSAGVAGRTRARKPFDPDATLPYDVPKRFLPPGPKRGRGRPFIEGRIRPPKYTGPKRPRGRPLTDGGELKAARLVRSLMPRGPLGRPKGAKNSSTGSIIPKLDQMPSKSIKDYRKILKKKLAANAPVSHDQAIDDFFKGKVFDPKTGEWVSKKEKKGKVYDPESGEFKSRPRKPSNTPRAPRGKWPKSAGFVHHFKISDHRLQTDKYGRVIDKSISYKDPGVNTPHSHIQT